jgi:hypothetical protein
MSHFAKIVNGIVTQVIVAEPEFFNTFVDTSPGEWVQTSYNTRNNQHPEGRPLRGNFAGIGYVYDTNNDVFYAPQPFPSWVLNNTTWTWEAPIPMPDTGQRFEWDETQQQWVEIDGQSDFV